MIGAKMIVRSLMAFVALAVLFSITCEAGCRKRDAGCRKRVTVYRAASGCPVGFVGGFSAAHAAINIDLIVPNTFLPC